MEIIEPRTIIIVGLLFISDCGTFLQFYCSKYDLDMILFPGKKESNSLVLV